MTIRPWHFRQLTPAEFDRVKAEKRTAFRQNRFGLKELAVTMSSEGAIVGIEGSMRESLIWDHAIRAAREAAAEEFVLRKKLEFAELLRAKKGQSTPRRDEDAEGNASNGGTPNKPQVQLLHPKRPRAHSQENMG